MLLSASTAAFRIHETQAGRKTPPGSLRSPPSPFRGGIKASLRRGDRLGHHVRIAAEPFGLFDELAALDLEDLHPTAAFVVGCGDLHGRHQAAEGEVLDRLEPLADV